MPRSAQYERVLGPAFSRSDARAIGLVARGWVWGRASHRGPFLAAQADLEKDRRHLLLTVRSVTLSEQPARFLHGLSEKRNGRLSRHKAKVVRYSKAGKLFPSSGSSAWLVSAPTCPQASKATSLGSWPLTSVSTTGSSSLCPLIRTQTETWRARLIPRPGPSWSRRTPVWLRSMGASSAA